jgi:HlyD family secretion protein
MSKKTIYILSGLLLAIIIAMVVFSKSSKSKEGIAVDLANVSQKTVIETVSATGKIQPESEVKISSEVSGEIIFLPIKEGDQVKKGQILARVNPELYTSAYNRVVASMSTTKAGLSQAEAQLKEAKANFDRNKTLFEKGVISKAEYDRITATYESSKANRESAYYNVQSAGASVSEARESLGRTTIFAPADGTISLLNTELGERVVGTQQMTGTEIMRIANLDQMEVEVEVNENDIVKISIGDEANIEVDAYLKKKFKGQVTAISNASSGAITADQVTNFKVKVRIIRDSYKDLLEGKPANYSPFRPGMTATVDIITRKKENVIAVPISAVVVKTDTSANAGLDEVNISKDKFECVFVEEKGKAKIKIIKTGIQDDTNIEILSGLKKGEKIIVGPYTVVTKELKSGDKVTTAVKDKVD